MKEVGIKFVISAAFAALWAYCKALIGPVLLVAIAMACDYFSGLGAAWINGELSSRKGAIGFVKKIGLALLIAAGIIIDWVIRIAAGQLGINATSFCWFGLLVAVWIVVNECISIVENIARMGVEAPPFLEKVIKRLKATTEKKGDEYIEEGDNE